MGFNFKTNAIPERTFNLNVAKKLFINARALKPDGFFIDGFIYTRTSLTHVATVMYIIISENRLTRAGVKQLKAHIKKNAHNKNRL